MKKVIFSIFCFFMMMNSSWAVTLSCPEVASPGEEIKISIKENKYNGLKVKYNFDSNFNYHNMTINSSWNSYYDGIDGFSIGNAHNQDSLIMDINVRVDMNALVNKDYTLELVDIEGNNSEYKSVSLDNVSCNIKLLSDINTLDNLIVDGVNLSPKFDKNVVSYRGITKKDRININAIVSDSESKIEGDIGEKILNIGVNTFIIKVTSPRGNIREYKLFITREIEKVNDKENNKSNDATLKSLSLSNGKIDFKSDNFLYNIDVAYEVENIEVDAIANDSKAKIDVVKTDGLEVGENTIEVIVTAEDGTKAIYVVVVNRKEKLSSDASIRDLIIKNYNLEFNSNIYNYDLTIDGEKRLDIEVILNDNKAKYTIKGNNDLTGDSVIEIEVIAEDDSSAIYNININKISESNSNTIFDYIKIIPLIGFVILIGIVLIIKIIKTIHNKKVN